MARSAGKMVAAVGCSGGELARRIVPREELTGDCRQALADYPGGILECKYGCLGLGSCAAACKLGAVKVGAKGIAEVDREKCVGCGLCVKACPQGIIRLVPREQNIVVACSSCDTGAATRKVCDAGCIAAACASGTAPWGLLESLTTIRSSTRACASAAACAHRSVRGALSRTSMASSGRRSESEAASWLSTYSK